MIEVEVKMKVNNFNSSKKELKKLNPQQEPTEYQEDIYFERDDIGFAKNDKALRIRKTTKKDESAVFVTYKGPKLDKLSKTREEIELGVEDSDKLKTIFERLGFYENGKVSKEREIYKVEKYVVSFDNIENLGTFIEIETTLEDNSDFKPEVDNILNLFKKLGVEGSPITTSYLELLEEKNKIQ
ncbi:class IV adenylate cyclase [Methanobrevibacter filiformis]|uniref:Adenylate cyclase CyaB n=1 Tax=Methanobrevibacter filiformis TaxID=55758 RepID=A0A165ZEU2_9EURY|nr:class IV adenylate cyclase [Methanobrevibacter filiformis]KZX10619.1 adenylate cyclase CyaB [Methanobrevibacter filiformis]